MGVRVTLPGLGQWKPQGKCQASSVKRARVDSRLIGEFEWSLYQRAFDGVRGDVDHKSWHGGVVVRSLFAGDWLRFLYLESGLQFRP